MCSDKLLVVGSSWKRGSRLSLIEAVAPVAQLVTFEPLDGWVVVSDLGEVTRSEIFAHIAPKSGERYCRECTKFGLAVDKGEELLYPPRDSGKGKVPQKDGTGPK